MLINLYPSAQPSISQALALAPMMVDTSKTRASSLTINSSRKSDRATNEEVLTVGDRVGSTLGDLVGGKLGDGVGAGVDEHLYRSFSLTRSPLRSPVVASEASAPARPALKSMDVALPPEAP